MFAFFEKGEYNLCMEYFKESILTLRNWLKIKSVKSAAVKDAPFGEGVKNMLLTALNEAEKLGFKTVNYDNYIGEVVFGEGDDEEGLAVLCHLDVVPEGDESLWSYPPYGAVLDGDKLFSRGVEDDKGPAAVCLYALKKLKDEGFYPSRKIKLIFGCDEESGWACIDHYKKVSTMPNEGFSPDGDFPVIYSEKGIYHIKYTFPLSPIVKKVSGGERVNVVPDKAVVEYKNGRIVEFLGKTAHGSTPNLGENAVKKAIYDMVENGAFKKEDYLYLFENENLFCDLVDESGCLTFSPNVVKVCDNCICFDVDVRYPSLIDFKTINERLKTVGDFTVSEHKMPLFVDRKSMLVTTLNGIYNNLSGRRESPVTTGGGTYARALKRGVAFGPLPIDAGGRAHMPDEYMTIEELKFCFDVYYAAIKELSK